MHGLESKPLRRCFTRPQCVLDYNVWAEKDAVRMAFNVVNFSDGRPGLRRLLHFLVLGP